MSLNKLIRRFNPKHDDLEPPPPPAADPRQMSLLDLIGDNPRFGDNPRS
jgi:hypothetical protein